MMTAARNSTVGTPLPPQDFTYLGAGGQVPRQRPLLGDDSAQVDDAPDPGRLRGGGDGTCGALVDIGEVVAGQRMHQVVEDLLVGDRRTHVVVDGEVCAHDLHAFAPRDLGQLRRGPGHHPHPVPGAEQFGDQPPADVAGGTEDYAPHIRSPS